MGRSHFGSRYAMSKQAAAIAFGDLPVLDSDDRENRRPSSANPRMLTRKAPRPQWNSYAALNVGPRSKPELGLFAREPVGAHAVRSASARSFRRWNSSSNLSDM